MPSIARFHNSFPQRPITFDVADTGYDAAATTVIGDGGDLQTAINNASLGDIIEITAGVTLNGVFTLKDKGAGDEFIYIRTSAYESLPAQGTRVAPSDASNMARLHGNQTNESVINCAAGAHHYRFVGIEFTNVDATRTSQGGPVVDLLAPSSFDFSKWIIFDRCYIHGTDEYGCNAGVAMDGVYNAIIDSYISEIHRVGQECQAVSAFKNPGPYKIVNNYLSAAGENVFFGGTSHDFTWILPTNIEIRSNHIYADPAWKSAIASGPFVGQYWTFKNNFELKNARRVLVEDNTFDNSWGNEYGMYPSGAQAGYSVQLTARDQSVGTAPWTTVEDVTIRRNLFRYVKVWININPYAIDEPPAQDGELTRGMSRVLIEHNLVYEAGTDAGGGGDGPFFQVSTGLGKPALKNCVIRQNTVMNGDNPPYSRGGTILSIGTINPSLEDSEVRNNIWTHQVYGHNYEGAGGWDDWTLNCVCAGNVYIGGSNYPSGNTNDSLANVKFTNAAGRDYTLQGTSPYLGKGRLDWDGPS